MVCGARSFNPHRDGFPLFLSPPFWSNSLWIVHKQVKYLKVQLFMKVLLDTSLSVGARSKPSHCCRFLAPLFFECLEDIFVLVLQAGMRGP